MADLILQIPYEKLGWAAVQTLWISTLYLSGLFLAWKIMSPLTPGLNYKLGLGALLSLPFIPAFLFMEHRGVLPPVGLADWTAAETKTTGTPLIEGLPKITGFDPGAVIPSFYFWIGILWTSAAFLLIVYHLYSLISLHLYCRNKPKLEDPKVLSQLHELTEGLGIRHNLIVKKGGEAESPALARTAGVYLLVPACLSSRYEKEEIKGLLLHELIHLKRKDYLFSALQRLTLSLFFFQPLVWLLNPKIDREREVVCDHAVTQLTEDSHTYGSTLVKLKLQMQSALSHSLNITDHNLVHRLRELTKHNGQERTIRKNTRRAVLAFTVMLLTLIGTIWNSYHLHPTHNGNLQTEKPTPSAVQERPLNNR